MKYEAYRVAPTDWRIVGRIGHGGTIACIVQHTGQDLRFTNMADAANWLYCHRDPCCRAVLMSDKVFERRRL